MSDYTNRAGLQVDRALEPEADEHAGADAAAGQGGGDPIGALVELAIGQALAGADRTEGLLVGKGRGGRLEDRRQGFVAEKVGTLLAANHGEGPGGIYWYRKRQHTRNPSAGDSDGGQNRFQLF